MLYLLILTLLAFTPTSLFTAEDSRQILEQAKGFYLEQQHENAFEVFLSILPFGDSEKKPISLQEKEVYEQALESYLNVQSGAAGNNGQLLIDTYGIVLDQHPDYYQLGFILASAYANCGNFPKFFDVFYASHAAWPDHYLAFKTKAILYIKLFERSCPGAYKEMQRERIMENLSNAVDRYPLDSSLYRLMISFARDDHKKKIVAASLNRILEDNIIIHRGDLGFYVQNALDNVDIELIERFLNRAKTWVQFSRIIIAAQQTIDQQRADRWRDHERTTYP